MKKITVYLICFAAILSLGLGDIHAKTHHKFKPTKLPDGWYTTLRGDPNKRTKYDKENKIAYVKSIKQKKIGNHYYAVINGQLSYSRKDGGKALYVYKSAIRTIQLSKHCIYEQLEDRSYFCSRNELFKQLPNIATYMVSPSKVKI